MGNFGDEQIPALPALDKSLFQSSYGGGNTSVKRHVGHYNLINPNHKHDKHSSYNNNNYLAATSATSLKSQFAGM